MTADRDDAAQKRRGPLAFFAIGAIRIYQYTLSPMFYALGVRCRHEPTCSAYAAEAFQKHKAGRAFWLTLSRLSRCHPFGSHGFDPVPETAPKVGWRFWRLGDWAWTERLPDQSTLDKTSEKPSSTPSSTTTTST